MRRGLMTLGYRFVQVWRRSGRPVLRYRSVDASLNPLHTIGRPPSHRTRLSPSLALGLDDCGSASLVAIVHPAATPPGPAHLRGTLQSGPHRRRSARPIRHSDKLKLSPLTQFPCPATVLTHHRVLPPDVRSSPSCVITHWWPRSELRTRGRRIVRGGVGRSRLHRARGSPRVTPTLPRSASVKCHRDEMVTHGWEV